MTWCDEFVCWWLSSLPPGELGGGEASGGPALHYGPHPAPLRKGIRLWCPRLVRNSSSTTNSCHPSLSLPCVAECRLPGEGQVLTVAALPLTSWLRLRQDSPPPVYITLGFCYSLPLYNHCYHYYCVLI